MSCYRICLPSEDTDTGRQLQFVRPVTAMARTSEFLFLIAEGYPLQETAWTIVRFVDERLDRNTPSVEKHQTVLRVTPLIEQHHSYAAICSDLAVTGAPCTGGPGRPRR